MKVWVVVVLLLMSVVFVACSPEGQEASAPSPVELTLTATDIAYDVSQIELDAGQTLVVTLNNEGALEHDFSILEIPLTGEAVSEEAEDDMAGHGMDEMTEEPAVHVAAPAGGTGTVQFTPSAPGEYVYYCTVAGHLEAGMVGTLIVNAP